jgi:hypothetical protein
VRAWWAYWLTLICGCLTWVGVAIATSREGLKTALGHPLWATILIAPIFLAGLNLVVFRNSHEVVCRLEVERHPWLSHLVGRGYSARTFALTGLVVLAFGVALVIGVIGGSR